MKNAQESISVLIVDDHRIFRDGIASMLHDVKEITIAGLASNGVEALGMIPSYRPDVIILDLSMPVMGGLDLMNRLQKLDYQPKVLVLSMHIDQPFVDEALTAGANGYLCKENTDKKELMEAIYTVNDGETYLGYTIREQMAKNEQSGKQKGNKSAKAEGLSLLSKRETEVLQMIMKGMSNQEIADATFVSIRTVETHKSNIMNKLNLKNTVELVKYAIKNHFFEI